MDAILEPVLRSPRLPWLVSELNEALRREVEARKRFRASLTEDTRAEFVNGEVINNMTARYAHARVLQFTSRLIGLFVELRGLGKTVVEQALTGFDRNDYAPDLCFWASAKAAAIHANTTVFPVPDFVVEVLSPSTEARDRGVKFEDYAAEGVGEYWIIDPEARVVEQYLHSAGQYQRAGKHSEGIIASRVITGFEIPVAAIFDDDSNLAAMRNLLGK